jgi:hypothetical protein
MLNGKPLAIDLFCGLGGWSDGFLAEGWQVCGYDIERHVYGSDFYPGVLILQSVLDLHGSMFRNADCIVASPPCQKYSYMAMPWSRGKRMADEIRNDAEKRVELNRLFNACFRIQREACEAAGRHIPMVVENVRGAIPWVGRSAWNYGSFHLWGDVPALMPSAKGAVKNPDTVWRANGCNSENRMVPSKYPAYLGTKGNGSWFGNYQEAKAAGRGTANRYTSSRSLARKAASAQIAKIPFALSSHIARVYRPEPA